MQSSKKTHERALDKMKGASITVLRNCDEAVFRTADNKFVRFEFPHDLEEVWQSITLDGKLWDLDIWSSAVDDVPDGDKYGACIYQCGVYPDGGITTLTDDCEKVKVVME